MFAFLTATALAYETDQLTDREVPLRDAAPVANQVLNELLEQAVQDTNLRTQCQASEAEVHRVLARAIYEHTARPARVPERGFFRSPGFTTYSARMETHPDIDRREWAARDDLFGTMTLWQSVILTMAGPSSTVQIGNHLVGTDKFDHFLNFGYVAWKQASNGRRQAEVGRFNTRTERQFFGMMTSKTYSYGDIAANTDGFVFYDDLLQPDGYFAIGEDGCVQQLRPFDWNDVVRWQYDEALNPSLHTRLVQKQVDRKLRSEPERYCRAYHVLGEAAYDAHLERIFEADSIPLPRRYEARYDPFELNDLCTSGQVQSND